MVLHKIESMEIEQTLFAIFKSLFASDLSRLNDNELTSVGTHHCQRYTKNTTLAIFGLLQKLMNVSNVSNVTI